MSALLSYYKAWHSFHSIYVNVGATSSTDYRRWTDVFADERRYTWDYFSIRSCELLCYIRLKERGKIVWRQTKNSDFILSNYAFMTENMNRIIGSYFVILIANLNGNNQFYLFKLERNQHYHTLPKQSAIINITVPA